MSSVTLAAASTTDLASSDGERVTVTGTATITSLGAGFPGCKREVLFASTPTLVHSASIFLPGGTNITVVANDVLTFRCSATGQWVLASTTRPNVVGALGYTPVNKAGDTGVGALALVGALTSTAQISTTGNVTAATMNCNGAFTSNGPVAIGSSGTIGKFNVGGGRAFFGSNGDLFAIALGFNDGRAQTGQVGYIGATDGTAPDVVVSNAGGVEIGRFSNGGVLSVPNGVTPGGGRRLSKITVSSAAPGTLVDGELYLRF